MRITIKEVKEAFMALNDAGEALEDYINEWAKSMPAWLIIPLVLSLLYVPIFYFLITIGSK